MSGSWYHSIVVLDVEASGTMPDSEKKKVSDDLYALVRAALEGSGIPADAVRWEDRGDGIFLLISSAVAESLLVDPFVDLIDSALAARPVGEPLLRLRVVIHHGEVIVGERTASGRAVDTAFVLLDSPELRESLKAARGGRLALAVGDDLYLSLIRGNDRPNPDAFRRRRLKTKYGDMPVWVTVTGVHEQPGSSRRTPDEPLSESSAPAMYVAQRDSYHVQGGQHGSVGGNFHGAGHGGD